MRLLFIKGACIFGFRNDDFFMKKFFITLWLMGGIGTIVFADAVLMEFVGKPDGDRIIINWKTGEERDINLFIVERSTDNKNFINIGELPPKGNNSSYEFIDTNLTLARSIYYYRLRIRRTNGTFQITDIISVIPKISSFAKTWGSIKALFQ